MKNGDCVYDPFENSDSVAYVTLPLALQIAFLLYSLRTILTMYNRMSHEKFSVMDDTEILVGEPSQEDTILQRSVRNKTYPVSSSDEMSRPLLDN